MTRTLLTALLAAGLGGGVSLADSPPAPNFEIKKVERLYLDDVLPAPDGERVVELYLRAETDYGQPVDNLRNVDLVVRDNGELVDSEDLDVSLLSTAGRGAACVLAIDTSRTMKGEPFNSAKAAALGFLERMGSFDRVAVVSFASQVDVVTSFGDARAEARVQLESLEVAEQSMSTVLYDGAHKAIELIRKTPDLPRRACVIVFSDGKDSGSVHSLEEVIELGRGSELEPRTPIFTIGYERFGGGGLATLKQISKGTAGYFFHAGSTTSFNDFFREARRNIWNSYVVRYPASMDGERHKIEVTVEGKSDVRSVTYPSIRGPVWPWLVGTGLAIVVVLGGWILASRRSSGELVFVSGPSSGERVRLRKAKLRIGALPDNDIVVGSPAVSRYHAQLYCRGRSVEIEDLGSSNHTYVNGTPIRSTTLRPGDKIRIADVDLVYER